MFFFLFSFFAFSQNVILYIGDGMGPSVINATRAHYHKAKNKMYLDELPKTAIVTTHSKDNYVTDSAASASAMSCGMKFNNGEICYQQTKNLLAKKAKELGYTVGLITNATIVHATPAAFYANAKSRLDYMKISQDLLSTQYVDMAFGGGTEILNEVIQDNKKGKNILSTQKDLDSFSYPAIGAFGIGHFPYVNENKKFPRLHSVAKAAVNKVLSDKKPFFLMIEGGRIDHALHKGKLITAIEETHDFDLLIREIDSMLDKQGQKDKTSIYVTSDHDTAGMDMSGYPKQGVDLIKEGKLTKSPKDSLPYLRFIDTGNPQHHTGVDVHLYARGKCSDQVKGTMENTHIYDLIKKCLETFRPLKHSKGFVL